MRKTCNRSCNRRATGSNQDPVDCTGQGGAKEAQGAQGAQGKEAAAGADGGIVGRNQQRAKEAESQQKTSEEEVRMKAERDAKVVCVFVCVCNKYVWMHAVCVCIMHEL